MPRSKHPPIDHEALRAARRRAGLSRVELAERATAEAHRVDPSGAVAISGSAVQTYEAGTIGPSPEKLEALAKALGTRPEAFRPAPSQAGHTRTV